MSASKYVLVTGATGQQGGAVVQALLAKNHRVRALTRNVDSPQAKQLAKQGVELTVGDFTDPDSLLRATTGIDAIYAMTTPFESGEKAETAQGIAIIKAAKQTGVGHLIYSSVGSANKKTGIPHFDSKYAVEEAIIASGIPYSISCPVYFMDNLFQPWALPGVAQGTLSMAMPGDLKLQQIAVADIGSFAVTLIERRDQVFGQRFDIAGDELTNDEVASTLSQIIGTEVGYQGFPVDVMREQSADMATMFEWFDTTGYSTNIAALHRDFPEVAWHDFKNWAQAQDWETIIKTSRK